MTPREREIASLIARGLTNKQIGLELSISERTVGAHVQNMLNKLTASNRAQIVALAAQPAALPTALQLEHTARGFSWWTRLRASNGWTAGLVLAITLIVAASDGGAAAARTSAHAPPVRQPVIPGSLVFNAELAGDGAGFSQRNFLGDPNASAVRFSRGAIEYLVLAPGGNTGNGVDIAPLKRYYADVTLSVIPGSGAMFWLVLDVPGSKHPGQHLVAIDTWRGQLGLKFFVESHDLVALGPTVRVKDLEMGRPIDLAVLVDPPRYEVFVDGVTVIDVRHEPGAPLQSPGFAVMGVDPGGVRLTSVRVYSPA